MTTTDAAGGAEDAIPAGNWQPAVLMVQTTNTSGTAFGGSYNPNANTNTIGIVSPGIGTAATPSPIGTWQPLTGVTLPEPEPDEPECKDGHYIDSKSIRVVRGSENEDEIFGTCLFCDDVIYIPHIVGGLTFEKAGYAVGRAMTLEDGDQEAIGPLLADLSALEREVKAEIARFKRALGMIEIARDLTDQRATA